MNLLWIVCVGLSILRCAQANSYIISTIAGAGNSSFDDDSQATSVDLSYPQAVCVDTSGKQIFLLENPYFSLFCALYNRECVHR